MNAPRDENREPTLLGVDSALYLTPTTVGVNSTTHAMLVELLDIASDSEPTFAVKITVDGVFTYIAKAVPGTAQSAALWQVKLVDETTGTVVTWADGNANFDNVATDLTELDFA